MKKILLLTLIGMMAFAGFTFADDTDTTERERPVQEQREKGDYEERILETVTTYAPELLDQYLYIQEQHEAIHVDLEALKEVHKAEKEAMRADFKAEMKALIESGELTREEAKVLFEEAKAEFILNKEALRAEIEALKASYGLSKDNFKALNESLKSLVELEDSAAINAHLYEMIAYYEAHVTFDVAKYNLLLNK